MTPGEALVALLFAAFGAGALAAIGPAYVLGLRRGRGDVAHWLGKQSASRLAGLAQTVNQPSSPPPAARPSSRHAVRPPAPDKEGP